MKHFRAGEFARKADVTIRTVHYYDRVGLLKPTAYSESGQRLYSELDYARLQQILTLKLIGLSLMEIKGLLSTDAAQITDLLDRQQRVLKEKARQLALVIETIENAQTAMRSTQSLDLEHFINIIKAVNMNHDTNWLDQFYTAEQQNKLAHLETQASLADQKQIGEAWKTLFADIRNNMTNDLNASEMQSLVERWDTLVDQATHGDPDLAIGLNSAYKQIYDVLSLDDTMPELRNWMQGMQEASHFIEQIRRTS